MLFEGKDMYMGFLQYELAAGRDYATFQGEGSLSVCIRSLMEWIAVLRVEMGDSIYELPFEFETIHLR